MGCQKIQTYFQLYDSIKCNQWMFEFGDVVLASSCCDDALENFTLWETRAQER